MIPARLGAITPARELEFECYWAAGGRAAQERENAEIQAFRFVFYGLYPGEWRSFVLRTGQLIGMMVRGGKPDPIRRRTIAALERVMK